MYENVPTVSSGERQQVLGALERLQAKLVQREEWSHSDAVANLRETLQSPLFSHILTLQHSIKQLRNQLSSMPPDACSDFSFSKKGQLIMSAVSPTSSSAPATLSSSAVTNGLSPPIHQTPPSDDLLQKWILAAAKGRLTEVVRLTRPLSGGLGFSVIGLSPAGGSSQGVVIKHIQPGGVAHRDGRLQERDQVLVINGYPLEAGISHQQALALLQQPGDTVELVVARERPLNASSPSATITSTDRWGHVEEIQLVNDGSGLGFGIVGGRMSGVVVRTLIPNSVADKDGRLRTGDHILCIGATPTSGLTSDQVVKVLQGCGSHVTMLIARDPKGLRSTAAPPPPPPDSAPVSALPPPPPARLPDPHLQRQLSRTPNLEGYEIHEVPLTKKEGQSLGISIIGYNPLTSQDAVGVFVKHVVPGSAADQSGNIRVHDRLIALDGVSLHGLTNQEVLEVMKRTGQTVVLSVVRKKPRALERSLDKVERESSSVSLRRSWEVKSRSSGLDVTKPKSETIWTSTVPLTRATDAELRAKWEAALGPKYKVLVVKLDPVIEDDEELQRSSKLLPVHTLRLGVELDSFDGHHYISSVVPGGPVEQHGVLRHEDELLEVNDVQLYGKSRREVVSFLKEVPPPFTLVCCRHPTFASEQEPESESEVEPEPAPLLVHSIEKRSQVTVEEMELKLSSMLSGENNQEPQQAGKQVQVSPAKEMQMGERSQHYQEKQEAEEDEEEEEKKEEEEEGEQGEEEDEKEEEEEEEEEEEGGELALWSPDVQVLELQKDAGKGLGFSILDYQDPLDAGRCVMVIRSLVPSGSAERHGGLLPGDQLVSVNQMQVDQLSLAEAVDFLKSVPPGVVHLGIRKPLVEGAERSKEQEHNTQQSAPQGSGDHSGLPKDPQEEVEDEEEPELILDGGLPRYTSSSMTSDLLPVEVGKEMAVDEDMEAKEKKMREEVKRNVEESRSSLPRRPPPTWEEWKLSASRKARGAEEEMWRQEELKKSVEEEEQEEDQGSISSTAKLILGLGDSRDTEADSELTLTDTDTESVRMIDRDRRKRRSQGLASLPIRGRHSDLPEREEGEGEETPAYSHWGPPRRVEVWPEDGQSLGLSIVGGRHIIKRLKNGEELKGIFIKQVLPNSPAAKTQCLKTGDKILEVSGVDLQTASHEEAVSAIKSAPSPVVFIVQSLSTTPRPVSLMAPSYSKHRAKSKESQRPAAATLPLRAPPPYRPPKHSEPELNFDLEQARGLV